MAVLQTTRSQEHEREVREWYGKVWWGRGRACCDWPGSQVWVLALTLTLTSHRTPQVSAGPGAAAGGRCPAFQCV